MSSLVPPGEPDPNKLPAFVWKLYRLVQDPATDGIVSWGDGGASFVVKQPAELANSVLPQYFKHGNFSSFVRQLNLYGFRKLGDRALWEFQHENFQRGNIELLSLLRRKPSSSSGASARQSPSPDSDAPASASARFQAPPPQQQPPQHLPGTRQHAQSQQSQQSHAPHGSHHQHHPGFSAGASSTAAQQQHAHYSHAQPAAAMSSFAAPGDASANFQELQRLRATLQASNASLAHVQAAHDTVVSELASMQAMVQELRAKQRQLTYAAQACNELLPPTKRVNVGRMPSASDLHGAMQLRRMSHDTRNASQRKLGTASVSQLPAPEFGRPSLFSFGLRQGSSRRNNLGQLSFPRLPSEVFRNGSLNEFASIATGEVEGGAIVPPTPPSAAAVLPGGVAGLPASEMYEEEISTWCNGIDAFVEENQVAAGAGSGERRRARDEATAASAATAMTAEGIRTILDELGQPGFVKSHTLSSGVDTSGFTRVHRAVQALVREVACVTASGNLPSVLAQCTANGGLLCWATLAHHERAAAAAAAAAAASGPPSSGSQAGGDSLQPTAILLTK